MRIAIVGAGPAGIFLSLLLKDLKGEIFLFEQNNNIGEKLKFTGGGRMNIGNKVFSVDQFSSKSVNLLRRIFKNPIAQNPMKIFDELGIEYVWEKNRAILRNQDAAVEVKKFEKVLCTQANLRLLTKSKVENIKKLLDGFLLSYLQEEENKEEKFDVVILSTGGMFRLGERSDKKMIYKLPESLDHKITSIESALSPLIMQKNPWGELAGLSTVCSVFDPVSQKKVEGDLLFTHQGVSGPAVLDFSLFLESDSFSLSFLPQIFEKDFIHEFNEQRQGKHGVKNFLKKYFPQRLVSWHLKNIGVSESVNISDISKESFKKLRKNLFHFSVSRVRKSDYKNSWTTKGGVSLNEIHTANLESKSCKSLFFIGELLDVSGLCGGYNISWAAISAKIVSEEILSI